MTTKAQIKREYDLLRELEGLLLQSLVKAEQLELAVERKKIVREIQRAIQEVEFECGVQHNAVALGHGED